ncbi:hypothetical protein JZU46_02795 [bacterium]|nr:hypothetical protein [bacterium]
MKVFKSMGKAKLSSARKENFYLNGECPYNGDKKLCGNWCALFYLSKATANLSAHVILGCKAGEKQLFVEEIVED